MDRRGVLSIEASILILLVVVALGIVSAWWLDYSTRQMQTRPTYPVIRSTACHDILVIQYLGGGGGEITLRYRVWLMNGDVVDGVATLSTNQYIVVEAGGDISRYLIYGEASPPIYGGEECIGGV